MAYVLSLGWPWFAGALALGGLVGFLSFSRVRDATFSGGWIVLLGLVALAIGFSTSLAEVFSGRDALTLDVAALAGLAYAAGLPLGGVLKSAAPEAERKPAKAFVPVIVASAPEPAAEPEPEPVFEPEPELAAAPEPAPLAEAAAADPELSDPPSMETPLAALEPASAAPEAPAARPARGKKSAPGVKPETLPAPREGRADDLARIKGIGPRSLEKLNALGIFHYDQIAAWNLDNAKWIGATIGAPGRVERDKWIQQARALASAGVEQ
ncbi:MAG: hypothetical protein ACR652_21630 [Methylocystis sp.]|uniref:hypothetical protein n=1 Tax=Methylocystis sp. TaxID=1911079 RepID=UPI003DA317B3